MVMLLFPAVLLFRFWYISVRQLVPDEAYYWVWSRHLAWGYLDHPPMVAFLIRLGTTLAGQNEFGVRWPGAVLAVGTAAVMWGLARKLVSPEAARWAAAILLLSPMLNVLGTIITPDTPVLFCVACALVCVHRAIAGKSAWWIGFGVAMGVGLVSKYTMVLPGAAVAVALLSTKEGRREYARPWVWLAAVIALAIFSPVIAWNAQRHWVSFAYQLNHGTTGKSSNASVLSHLNDVAQYFGGQLGVFTPVFFVMGLIVLWKSWRRFASVELFERVLLLAATIPLVLFAISSLKRRPEPNWPLIAYLPLTILIVKDVFDASVDRVAIKRGRSWLVAGLVVAICGTVILHAPEVIWRVFPQFRQKSFEEQFGWRELAAQVRQARQLDGAPLPLFSDTYQMASEMSFYLHDEPMAWTLTVDRATELDFLEGRPDPGVLPAMMFVSTGNREAAEINGLNGFAKVRCIHVPPMSVAGHLFRECTMVVAER